MLTTTARICTTEHLLCSCTRSRRIPERAGRGEKRPCRDATQHFRCRKHRADDTRRQPGDRVSGRLHSFQAVDAPLKLLWQSRDLLQECIVQKGGVANTRYGQFKHDDMIGMRYGCKVRGIARMLAYGSSLSVLDEFDKWKRWILSPIAANA